MLPLTRPDGGEHVVPGTLPYESVRVLSGTLA